MLRVSGTYYRASAVSYGHWPTKGTGIYLRFFGQKRVNRVTTLCRGQGTAVDCGRYPFLGQNLHGTPLRFYFCWELWYPVLSTILTSVCGQIVSLVWLFFWQDAWLADRLLGFFSWTPQKEEKKKTASAPLLAHHCASAQSSVIVPPFADSSRFIVCPA